MVIYLLIKKKYLNQKLKIKLLIFQLNFVSEGYLLDIRVLLARLAKVSDGTKCLFLNDEPCIVRSPLMNMNPNELKYYSFMISLNKYSKNL